MSIEGNDDHCIIDLSWLGQVNLGGYFDHNLIIILNICMYDFIHVVPALKRVINAYEHNRI